ncbi:hypothetical protein ES703_65738 [subsurface metagenome]
MNDNLRPSQKERWLKQPLTAKQEHQKQRNRKRMRRPKDPTGKTTDHKESRPAKRRQVKSP